MSTILVRKYCQPVLDAAGYPMFHCAMDGGYEPGLVIYTSCGKRFTTVHGVSFSKWKPAIEECKYSGALLQEWMDRHEKDFADYVDAYTEYYSLNPPERLYKKGNLEIELPEGWSDRVDVVRKFAYTDEKGIQQDYYLKVSLWIESGNVRNIDWTGCTAIPLEEFLSKLRFSKAVKTQLEQFLKTHTAFFESQKESRKRFEEAQKRLETCSI